MATSNTDKTWFWYIRSKGKNQVIGIVDQDGSVNSTGGLNIEYWYTQIPDEVLSRNDSLPIPIEYEEAFLAGVVHSLLRMFGVENSTYQRDYERGVYDATHSQIRETAQSAIIKPFNLRRD